MNALEILEKCHRQGIILNPMEDNRLEYEIPESAYNDEILAELKNHKWELLNILNTIAVFDGRVITDANPLNRDYTAVLCPYQGEYRHVHPEVCKWHISEQDPECVKCQSERKQRTH